MPQTYMEVRQKRKWNQIPGTSLKHIETDYRKHKSFTEYIKKPSAHNIPTYQLIYLFIH